MKKIFSILFALVLVVSLGLVTAAPVLAGTTIHVPGDYATIQEAIDATGSGDTIMVAAGDYHAFVVEGKPNISIISTEGATITTADSFWIGVGPIGDAWVMAAVKDSENINIEGIDFDGAELSEEEVVVGIAYVDSTGGIADLTVENIIGTELGAGVAIIGDVGTSAVDLSGVTVDNSMAGVAIWNAEANIDGCTITEMSPDGGFGIMESGVGIVIGIPGEDWGPSTVEMKGSTISNNNNIRIYACDGSTLEAHFNNIIGNAEAGLMNDGGETVDATYNWWGRTSGPYHETLKPNGVWGDVDFEPWLKAEVATEDVVTMTVTDGDPPVDATDEADAVVLVDGTATVTVARYKDNPGGRAPTGSALLGKYFNVYVTDTTQVNEIEIRLYYIDAEVDDADIDDEESLRLFWWNGNEWKPFSDTGVNTDSTGDYSGYMWAKIGATTTLSLGDSQENLVVDGGGETPATPPPPCCTATVAAASGTNAAKKLDIMREFRDAVLLPNSLGARLVSLYYRTSPPLAGFISQHEVLRTAVRLSFLDPIVAILNWSHDLWSERGP